MLELYQAKNSLVHTLNARVKIIFTLVFILTLNLCSATAWPAYILYFSVLLSIILLSKLGWSYVLKRSLFALPFILAAVPLIFWGPQPVSHIQLWDSIYLPFSMAGFERCISIIIKAWLSVIAAILLTSTTPFLKLISGFRQLHVPLILISIIELMWRYLFVLVDEVNRLIRARSSRSSTINGKHHPGGSVFWRGRVTGNMAGSLFLRSIERSERIYAAMLSRGYSGEPFEEQTGIYLNTDRWVLSATLIGLIVIFMIGLITGK